MDCSNDRVHQPRLVYYRNSGESQHRLGHGIHEMVKLTPVYVRSQDDARQTCPAENTPKPVQYPRIHITSVLPLRPLDVYHVPRSLHP